MPNKHEEILKIIEEYGNSVDGEGWEIDERFEAVNKIEALLQSQREEIIKMIEAEKWKKDEHKICGHRMETACIVENEILEMISDKIKNL